MHFTDLKCSGSAVENAFVLTYNRVWYRIYHFLIRFRCPAIILASIAKAKTDDFKNIYVARQVDQHCFSLHLRHVCTLPFPPSMGVP